MFLNPRLPGNNKRSKVLQKEFKLEEKRVVILLQKLQDKEDLKV